MADPDLRILHVAETAKGGVGTYLNEIVPLQAEAFGLEAVRVIAPQEHLMQLPDVPSSMIVPFPRRGRDAATVARLARAIRAEAARLRPTIIHAHSTGAGAIVRTMFAFARSPRIVHCAHGWPFLIEAAGWKQRLAEIHERVMARFCDGVVCISRHEALEARRIGVPESKIVLVPNGVSRTAPRPEAIEPWRGERLRVLFVGRLDRQKGFDLLSSAAADLVAEVQFKVAGAAVANAAAMPNLPANMELLGWCSLATVEAYLQAADVVVMPSRWEGFGLVAIEAMRAGKPVIATRIGGLPEIIEHGRTGLLIEPNSVQALVLALRALDRPTAASMGAKARLRFLERFTIEGTQADLIRLYRRLLSPENALPSQAEAHSSTASLGRRADEAQL